MIDTIQNQEGTSKYSLKFWLMMAIFYSLFVIRNIIGFSFPVIIYLAWIGVMALLIDEHEMRALLISFIPLYPAFQYKYATILFLAIYVVRFCRQLKPTLLVVPGVLLMVWELLHHSIGTFNYWEFIRGFIELVCLMAVMFVVPKKRSDVCQLSRVFAISAVVAFFLLLVSTLMAREISLFELMESGFRLGNLNDENTDFKFVYNANGLGFLCNMVIGGILITFYHKKGKIIDAWILAFIIFIGLLTTSRTFLLILLLTILVYIFFQHVSLWKKIRTLFIILGISGIALLFLYLVFPNIIANYIVRFSVDDVTNGRDFLFSFYNEFIFSSVERMFFGVGLQDIAGKMYLFKHVSVLVPHNGYQEMWVAWGILGFLLAALFFYGMVVHAKRRSKNKRIVWIHYLPLLLLLVNILAGQFFTASFKMLSLVYVYEMIAASSDVM